MLQRRTRSEASDGENGAMNVAVQFEERAWARDNRLSGAPLAPLLPTVAFEDNLVVNVDGSFGMGWRCIFPYLLTLGDARSGQLFTQLKKALNVLPDDFDVQVIFSAGQRTDELEKRLAERLLAEGILADYAAEQKRGLLDRFQRNELRWMEGHVILIRKNPFPPGHGDRLAKKSTWAKLKGLFLAAEAEFGCAEAEWERVKQEFFNYADSLHADLEQAGFLPQVLEPDGCLDLLFSFYNGEARDAGGRPRKFNPTEELPLSDYFLPSPCHWDRDSGEIRLGRRLLKVCVVRTPPENVRFSQFAGLLLHGRLFKTMHIVTCRRADLEKRKKLVKDRIPELEARARKDPEFIIAHAEAVRELCELGAGTEKTWMIQQVFVVGGDSREELDRHVLAVRKAAEEANGMRLDVETHACLDFLIAAQPFWTRDKDKNRLNAFNTSQLVTQLPACGQNTYFNWADDAPARIGAIYETTSQTLVNFFPHEDRRFGNANIMVLGASGSGKGMAVNDLIAQMRLRHPARFVVIDIGGSYRKTSEALAPGGYFDLTLKQTGRVINPFYISDQEKRFPDADEIDGMVRFVERILVGQDEKKLAPEQTAVIEQTIVQLFRAAEGVREVTLGDFRALLQENPRGEKLAQRLARWVGTGSFANLFDGKNQLDTNNWLTVFDLTAIKENKLVCPVMFGAIFSIIAQLAARYPHDLKFVVFDECAEFLRDPLVAAYIETCYRQMRKFGVSVAGISQGLEEWLSTSSKTAFVNNTTHLLILRQDVGQAADLIRETFGLSEHEREIVTRLQSIPGEFSQALLWQKLGEGKTTSSVIVKRPTPLGYALGTTNPRDKTAFQELRDRGLSYHESVRQFAQTYPQGVARGKVTCKS
jgi:hypothetical protein